MVIDAKSIRVDISPRYFQRAINSLSGTGLETRLIDYINEVKQEGEQVTRSKFIEYVNQMAQNPAYAGVFYDFRIWLIKEGYMKVDANGQPVIEGSSGTTVEEIRKKFERKTEALEKII